MSLIKPVIKPIIQPILRNLSDDLAANSLTTQITVGNYFNFALGYLDNVNTINIGSLGVATINGYVIRGLSTTPSSNNLSLAIEGNYETIYPFHSIEVTSAASGTNVIVMDHPDTTASYNATQDLTFYIMSNQTGGYAVADDGLTSDVVFYF